MTHNIDRHPAPATRRRPLGMPFLALVGLAALGLPAVVMHDLHLIDPTGPLNLVLRLVPFAAWIWVAVAKRVPNPFVTVLVIGSLYGAMLVIAHQLLWAQAMQGALPSVGGGPMATVIPRLAAIPSGLITGALVGAIAGLLAWGIQAVLRRRRHPR